MIDRQIVTEKVYFDPSLTSFIQKSGGNLVFKDDVGGPYNLSQMTGGGGGSFTPDGSYVRTTGNQNITGNKSFSGSGTFRQLSLGSSGMRRGILDINDFASVGDVTVGGITPSSNLSSQLDDSNGYNYAYNVYAYKTGSFGRVYSKNPYPMTYSEDSSYGAYTQDLSWVSVPGAHGYRVVIVQDEYNGYASDAFYETNSTSITYYGNFPVPNSAFPVQVTPNYFGPDLHVNESGHLVSTSAINAYTFTGQQLSLDYSNTSNNFDGTNAHIHMSNPVQGQNLVNMTIAGKQVGRWRTDYLGGISWGAGTNAASYSGYHDFYIGGDYPNGRRAFAIRSNGYVGVTTNVSMTVTQPFDVLNKFVIKGDGSVGIGTTNPTSGLLQVVGTGVLGQLNVPNVLQTFPQGISGKSFGIGSTGYFGTYPVAIYDTGQAFQQASLYIRGTGQVDGWRGRVIAGGDDVCFLMGQFNNGANRRAWLGGHNAALNAWTDLWVNPDGTTNNLFLGNKTSSTTSPMLIISNVSGRIDNTVQTFITGFKAMTAADTGLLAATGWVNQFYYPRTNPSGYGAGGGGGVSGITASGGTISGNITITGLGMQTSVSGQTLVFNVFPPALSYTTTIDWSKANVFYTTLTGNSTFSFTGDRDGQTIVVSVVNSGANTFTPTWPGNVRWSSGIIPPQSSGTAPDIYTFIKINTGVYGNAVQTFF